MSRNRAKKSRTTTKPTSTLAPGRAGSMTAPVPNEAAEQNKQLIAKRMPTVTICTVTYNRQQFLPLLQRWIASQTYPHELIDWVLVDDSDNNQGPITFDPALDIRIHYHKIPHRMPLGRKRNYANSICQGEIIVYMDDDDWYPPTRVQHAVEALMGTEKLMAGSSRLPILLLPEQELWIAGPYGENHATAGTFAFKRALLEQTSYDDASTFAEEKTFLKSYTIPMAQLEPEHTILCIGHNINTYDKRQLKAYGNNPQFRRIESIDARDNQLMKMVVESFIAVIAPATRQEEQATCSSRAENTPVGRVYSLGTYQKRSRPHPVSRETLQTHLKIVIPSYNCEAYIKECIDSVRNQTYTDFQAVIVDDCSSDLTASIAREAIAHDPRFQLLSQTQNLGCLSSFINGINTLQPGVNDVIVCLDGDDRLATPDALLMVAFTYSAKQCLLTYGSFLRASNNGFVGSPYDTKTVIGNNFRQSSWKASHLRTFKAGLFNLVDTNDLRDESGEILRIAGDIALMHPLIEIAGYRSEHIHFPLYRYNDLNPLNDHRKDPEGLAHASLRAKGLRPYGPAPFLKLFEGTDQLNEESVTGQQRIIDLARSHQAEHKLVSVVVPTYNRSKHIPNIINCFLSQTWPNRELIILDDSERKCEYAALMASTDERITYRHESNKQAISTKRQALCNASRGEIIVHFDDDDYYAPQYLETVVEELERQRLDFIKLRSWCSYHQETSTYGFCNTSMLNSTRFHRLSSSRIELFPRMFSDQEVQDSLYGFGFSYAYKRKVIERVRHPDGINFGDDIAFAKQCMASGIDIGLWDDIEGQCIHIIHSNNTSSCFAQHLMNAGLLQEATSIRPLPQDFVCS